MDNYISVAESQKFDFGSFTGVLDGILGTFDCWGVSVTPEQAAQWVQNDLLPWYNNHLTALPTSGAAPMSAAFTQLSKWLSAIYEHQAFHKSESAVDCSKNANQVKMDGCAALLADLHEYAQNSGVGFTVSSVTINAVQEFPHSQGISEKWKGKTNRPTIAKVYTFKSGADSVIDNLFGNGTNNSGNKSYSSVGGVLTVLLLLGLLFTKSGKKFQHKYLKSNG